MARLNESRIGARVTDAFAVRASTSTVSSLHAQHGVALIAGVDHDVTVTVPGLPPMRGRRVVVPPHLPHAVSCPGPTLGFLYDPEQMPHVAGFSRLRGGAFPLEGPLGERLGAALLAHRAALGSPQVLEGLAQEAAGWLGSGGPHREPDWRVARVLEAWRENPCAERSAVVARTRLSQAHLQALFVRDVGLPIRTWRLWQRLLVAVASLARLDATSAAHAAGFADLAHFSRTCRRMLGYSPRLLGSSLLARAGEE
jgi:AraC-like DNA-binding protein